MTAALGRADAGDDGANEAACDGRPCPTDTVDGPATGPVVCGMEAYERECGFGCGIDPDGGEERVAGRADDVEASGWYGDERCGGEGDERAASAV